MLFAYLLDLKLQAEKFLPTKVYDFLYDEDKETPKLLIADKGCNSAAIREDVEEHRGTMVIPARKNRKNPVII